MSLLSVSSPVPALLALLLSLGPVTGCARDDGQKLAVVQALAQDLGSAKLIRLRAGCRHLAAAQRELFLCDGLLQTLLHYAPGFPGSTITAIGASSGGYWNRPARLRVHYEGRQGSGNLLVILRREGRDWRLAALAPQQ